MGVNPHADRVLAAVASATGPAHADGRTIAASWNRCLNSYRLEPHRMPLPSVLSTRELKDVRGPLDEFVGLARGEIERLYARLSEQEYVVTLNDSTGVTLLLLCPEARAAEARAARLVLGSVWAEESQGTNGIGTSIKTGGAVSIVQDDHFSSHFTGLSCTVAPIFDPAGRLLSVLNVMTARSTSREVQAIVRGVVARSARRIENLYFSRRLAGERVVRLSRQDDFADIAAEVRVALDAADRIAQASPGAAELLRMRQAELVGSKVQDVLEFAERGPEQDVRRAASRSGETVFVKAGDPAARHGRAPDRGGDVAAGVPDLVAEDPRLADQLRLARRLIDRGLPILIQGETGTGKSQLARALHASSARAGGGFVSINCAAIPEELIESELFGYRAGAFTGAAKSGYAGRLLEADGGTLFLDEIGDMPLALQTRLLQVLSDGEFVPVGATAPVSVDLAVISASLHDLGELVRQGRFREDLYFRLNGCTLALPPLRERRDRGECIDRIFAEEARGAGCPDKRLAGEARDLLLRHGWPGNLRELRHCCRYAMAVSDGALVELRHLPPGLAGAATATKAELSRQVIELALQQARWNVSVAARRLATSRSTLHRKIKELGLSRRPRDS